MVCLKDRYSPAALARNINLQASRNHPNNTRSTARESRTGFVFSRTSNVAESILRKRTLTIDTITMHIKNVKLFLTVKVHPPLRTTDEGWGMHNKNI
jgi:hypothetical protein